MSKISAEGGVKAPAEFVESASGEAVGARIPVHAKAKGSVAIRRSVILNTPCEQSDP